MLFPHQDSRQASAAAEPTAPITGRDGGIDDDLGADVDLDADRHTHILILGLVGSGKSTVGLRVANELGRPFVDNNSIVELRTGHPPDELAVETDLATLHAAEVAALRQVLARRDAVVYAAAPSVIDALEPRDLASTWCVWLEASPQQLAARVADDRPRPLLGSDPTALLAEEHEQHSQRGRELADQTIATDGMEPDAVARLVCRAWRSSHEARSSRRHRTSGR